MLNGPPSYYSSDWPVDSTDWQSADLSAALMFLVVRVLDVYFQEEGTNPLVASP
jgi:hypothetical protein